MSGLSAPRLFFGVHAFTPYSRSSGLPYGTVKVLKSSSMSLSAALVELLGGSSKYAWGVEVGPITAELQLKGNDYKDFLFTLFLGFTPTANGPYATGNVSALTNTQGTSVFKATTGIASIAVKSGSETDVKYGKYVLKATDATHVDVYIKGDIDIARGTDGTIQDDLLKVTSSPLLVPGTGGTVDIPNFGLTLTGGSGTVGFTTGDTAEFRTFPESSASSVVNIGSSSGTLFPEFGSIVHAQKRGDQELTELDVYRCIGAGMPINFDMNAWSEYDIKVKCMYDSAKDGVFGFTNVSPTGT